MPFSDRATKNQRLLRLAQGLRQEVPSRCFRFDVLVSGPSPEAMLDDLEGCGTVACAYGFAPMFFNELGWDSSGYPIHWSYTLREGLTAQRSARRFFCNTDEECYELFCPGSKAEGRSGLPATATRLDVAKHIENWVLAHPVEVIA